MPSAKSAAGAAPDSAAAKSQRARLAQGKRPHPAALPPIPTVIDTPDKAPAGAPAERAGDTDERIHIKALIASPLNPRKTFPEDQIRELADSIAENGLLQPLTARIAAGYLENIPSAREVYIGGRRLRALELLFAEGRWPHGTLPDFLVPVIRRDVDDLELLTIAIAENVNRADMHPLEEGQAFAELRKRGRSAEEIGKAYGKTKRWVEQRMQVATGLDATSLDLFAAGKINFEAARELVRVDPEERKRHTAAIAKGETGYGNATEIKARINAGLPEVSLAIFDLALYTGDFVQGGSQHNQTRRFADADQFRALQKAAITEREFALAEKWAFVEVIHPKNNYDLIASEHGFDRLWSQADPAKDGALIGIAPDLKVSVIEGVCRGKAPAIPTKADMKAAGDAVASIGTGRREHAHHAKTRALQEAVLGGGHRAALEMAIMALLGDQSVTGIRTDDVTFDSRAVAAPLLRAMDGWRKTLGTGALRAIDPAKKDAAWCLEFSGGYTPDPRPRLAIYEALRGQTDDAIAALFDTLVAARCRSSVEYGSDGASLGNRPLAIAAAERYGVDMAAQWRIDADYLAKLQADDLHALAGKINLWVIKHEPNNHDTISFGDLQKMKVAERRAEILRFVVANDVRYIPPEMRFADRKEIETALRGTDKPKAKPPEQLDIVDAIAKAPPHPANPQPEVGCTIIGLDGILSAERLAALAAALPNMPEYGRIYLPLAYKNAKLALLKNGSNPTVYKAETFDDGRAQRLVTNSLPELVDDFVERWLNAATQAPSADEQTVDRMAARPSDGVNFAIIAFVTSPDSLLNETLLDALADALPLHPRIGDATLTLRVADSAETLTLIVENEDADPYAYLVESYTAADGTQRRPIEFDDTAVEDFITRWIDAATADAEESVV